MFDVQVQHIGDTAVVAPAGELDLATAHELGAALAEAAYRGAPRVILDLRRLTFVDSSGIGVIVTTSWLALPLMTSLILIRSRLVSASGDGYGLIVHGDRFARNDLPSAAGLDLAVDQDTALEQQLASVAALVDEVGQLEQLAEADGVVADLDGPHQGASVFTDLTPGPP